MRLDMVKSEVITVMSGDPPAQARDKGQPRPGRQGRDKRAEAKQSTTLTSVSADGNAILGLCRLLSLSHRAIRVSTAGCTVSGHGIS
jgi:hypothetical protein